MKLRILSTIAIAAILGVAAARPACADPLFSGLTLNDMSTCSSSTGYPYDKLQACERAMDDLSAQSKTTTDQIDLRNVGLAMANTGIIAGYLCEELGISGSSDYFSGARSLLQTIQNNPMSSEVAQRANTMLAMMDEDGI